VLLNSDVIQGRYLSDLLDQPRALRATWDSLRDTSALERISNHCHPQGFERIVLTGMGSSYHGLHPLAIKPARSGWTPVMLETSELIHSYPHLLTPSTLIVAVSQSGKSVETVRLLEMNAGKAAVIGVTNQAESPLALQAQFTVLTAAGEEFTVSCKTYVSAQISLLMVAAALSKSDLAARLRDLESAPEIVDSYLRDWTAHVEEFIGLLGDLRDLFLVGRGTSLAAVGTGALIIKESALFHAEGMSSAAFRHGPFEMLKPGVCVAVFAGDAGAKPLNAGLLRDIQQTPARALWLSADAESAACRVPQTADLLRPIVEILPVQMITLALAVLANHQPGKFARATKITVVE
jgi:glucosamine--fructose-6-phosphate aminotransferase (isomerizing)